MPYKRRYAARRYPYPMGLQQRRRVARRRNYGTSGRGVMGLEKKFYDWGIRNSGLTSTTITHSGQGFYEGMYATSNQNPQGISVGTGPSQRIGRKIGIDTIELDITLNFRWFNDPAATNQQPCRFKVDLLLDKQANGLSPAPNLYETPSQAHTTYANAFRDLTTARRYKIMKTIEGLVQPPNNVNLQTPTSVYNDVTRKFTIRVKFKKAFQMIYNDTATGAFAWTDLPSYAFKPVITAAGASTGEPSDDYCVVTWNLNGRTRYFDA